jgi:hypothetical protein
MKALKFLAGGLVIGFACCPLLAGQQPARHLTSVPDLFNQEAEASDSAGIHKYSEDLIGLIVPPEAGKAEIEQFANRLAQAEQSARAGQGKLVAETNVVRAFNELMSEIGAPISLRTDEASMRRFRGHGASIKAFPALLSADRNGTNCNPGEAVFLIYVIISGNGTLAERYLDSAQIIAQRNFEKNGGRGSVAGGIVPIGSNASWLLSSYSLHHNRKTTVEVFNNLADILGF